MKGPDVAQRAGISYRQLDHWTTQGYLEAMGSGSGHTRDYTWPQIRKAECMGKLIKMGFTASGAAKVAGMDSTEFAQFLLGLSEARHG